MKGRTCSELFCLADRKTGAHRSRKYDFFIDAIEALLKSSMKDKFGVLCIETYTYFDDDGNFKTREVYENFIDEDDYITSADAEYLKNIWNI